jgi:predicted flap endonuclease-1-like 5' DNA nuclease
MGDEKDPSATERPQPAPSPPPAASSVAPPSVAAPSVAPPSVVPPSAIPPSVVPRPVSVVPRPASSGMMPTSRMPPPPSARGCGPGAAGGGYRSAPPPPPQRLPPSSKSEPPTLLARPSVLPRPPATPPPPAEHISLPPSFARPLTQPPSMSATAQLEQRLGAAQIELRKLASERHTLRARLRREADRLHELESALRAEQELRRQAGEAHSAVLSGLRTRVAELENDRDRELARLGLELLEARADAQTAREAARSAELAAAELSRALHAVSPAPAARPGKPVHGLRRIRGIGPAYQRVLEQLGVTRVEDVAAWTEADVLAFADKLRIKAERIVKDDWVGQARALTAGLDAGTD